MLRPLGFIAALGNGRPNQRPRPVHHHCYILPLGVYEHEKQCPVSSCIRVLYAGRGHRPVLWAFFINIFSKISAHAVGMGGLLAMVIITMLRFSHDVFTIQTGLLGTINFNMNAVLIIVIVLCGLVGTSRLLLKAHEPRDLYGGFISGVCCAVARTSILYLVSVLYRPFVSTPLNDRTINKEPGFH